LELMAQGHSNAYIADHFALSLKTVRNHVSNILAKLGTSTRAQAVVRAPGGEIPLLRPRAAGMPGLQQGAPEQRPVAVDQHLADVGLGPVQGAHPRPRPPGPHQRLLGQVLGLGAVAGQQVAQPVQPPVLAGEELPELQLRAAHAHLWAAHP
jgi:hypothetical protein